jgi:hypothetical protein
VQVSGKRGSYDNFYYCVYPWETGGDLPVCDFFHSLTIQVYGSLGYVMDVVKQCSFMGRDLTVLSSAYLPAWCATY